jgi:hypothetical protein
LSEYDEETTANCYIYFLFLNIFKIQKYKFLQHIAGFETPKNLRYSFYIAGIKLCPFVTIQDCILGNATHNLAEFYISAILVQSQKAEIFQVGKRNITNQKMIDIWGNAKIALPLAF